MSGIYGIYRFDGAPVERETLALMRNAMAYYGPDGGGEFCEGSVGLGHLLLKATPEDSFENQPISCAHLNLVAFARLDNRDDLLREFSVSALEGKTLPDSDLVMRAYIRWGADCTDHINGDWQFAVWNNHDRQLFVARDHHGNTGLYYYSDSKFFAFASNINALLALPEVPCRPDLLKAAQVLTSWQGEGWRTSYEELYRLPPAHTINVAMRLVKLYRYWYPEKLQTNRFKNENDYIEQFISIYRHAICRRIHSTSSVVGISHSGGLDSGSITAFAGPALLNEGKKLAAFTSIPLFKESLFQCEGRIGDEWEHAASTVRMAGKNVEHTPIFAEDVSVLNSIEMQLITHSSPGHAASNQYWIVDLLSKARDLSINTLLTGQCGNATVSYFGDQFIDAIRKKDFVTSRNILLYSEKNLLISLKKNLARPLLLPLIRNYRNYIKAGSPWSGYSAINDIFANQLDLHKEMLRHQCDPSYTGFNTNWQASVFRPGVSPIGAIWHEAGAMYGMNICDPTADRRVVEFCFQTPADQFRKHGEDRLLIRRAMNGRMPDKVLHSKKRGLQGADIALRVFAEKDSIGKMLNKLEKNELVSYCIDVSKMKGILNSLSSSVNARSTMECQNILLRGLGVGLFLNKF